MVTKCGLKPEFSNCGAQEVPEQVQNEIEQGLERLSLNLKK